MSFNNGNNHLILRCSYLSVCCLSLSAHLSNTSSSWHFKQLLSAVGTVSSDRFLSDLQLGNQKESLKFLNRSHKSSWYTALRHKNTDLFFLLSFCLLPCSLVRNESFRMNYTSVAEQKTHILHYLKKTIYWRE